VAVLLAAAALPMAGCGSGGKADDADGTRGGDTTSQRPADDSTWAEGITPEWMSEQMGLDIPPTARSAEAAYEITSQFDTGLLTFTLTRSEAEKYLAENPPQGKWPGTHRGRRPHPPRLRPPRPPGTGVVQGGHAVRRRLPRPHTH